MGLTEEGAPAQPWRRFTPDKCRRWAEAIAPMVTVDRQEQLIAVSGVCPECGHSFYQLLSDRRIPEDAWTATPDDLARIATGGARNRRFDWTGTLSIDAACYCEEPHPQRPGIISHGCGAFGRLEDTPAE